VDCLPTHKHTVTKHQKKRASKCNLDGPGLALTLNRSLELEDVFKLLLPLAELPQVPKRWPMPENCKYVLSLCEKVLLQVLDTCAPIKHFCIDTFG